MGGKIWGQSVSVISVFALLVLLWFGVDVPTTSGSIVIGAVWCFRIWVGWFCLLGLILLVRCLFRDSLRLASHFDTVLIGPQCRTSDDFLPLDGCALHAA